MLALVFKKGKAELVPDYPEPQRHPRGAVIKVNRAGVCRTDIEITRGYLQFEGVLGHEFVGAVSDCADETWLGKRVVGEINAACGQCDWCARGLGRHCPNRKTLGIAGLDGCIAEYCELPVENLHLVPDEMNNDIATFIEPLSAAYEILEQIHADKNTRCAVIGDGKLGILCAWVLSTITPNVLLVGRHESKLKIAKWNRVAITQDLNDAKNSDLVIEASGRAEGLRDAMAICRPRGTLVLKSTIADPGGLNLAPIVINEITMVGSRCGVFKRGIEGYMRYRFPLEHLISGRYPLRKANQALLAAENRSTLKILIDVS